MDSYTKKFISITIIFCALAVLYVIHKKNEIKKNKTTSIAKLTSKAYGKGPVSLYYYFYYKQNKIKGSSGTNSFDAGTYKIDSCYEVIFSNNNPNYNEITQKQIPCPCNMEYEYLNLKCN